MVQWRIFIYGRRPRPVRFVCARISDYHGPSFCQPPFPTRGEKNCDISLISCASRLLHFSSRYLQPRRGEAPLLPAQPFPRSFTGPLITTSTCLLTYNQTAWRKTLRL